MNEESAQPERGEFANPLATAIALTGGATLDPRAAEYLEKQSRLADLQIEGMERERRLHHWSLRFVNISAVMKVTFEIAVAFIMLAIAGLIALAIWTAAHDDALVIEAFNVPQDMAAKGLSGQVIATQVQDRIAFIQSHADTLRAPDTFRNNWGDDIKVEIPDTGVSVGEAYRFLVSWLGHQTHITGEMWHDAKGIALSARAGSEPAKIFRGPETDLDSLVVKAAEFIYWQTQPYRYSVYLGDQGRVAEALTTTKDLAENGSWNEKAWAYSRWGTMLDVLGDFSGALDKQRRAIAFDPRLPHAFGNLSTSEGEAGHAEDQLRDNEHTLALLQGAASRNYVPFATAIFRITQDVLIAEETGDFARAVARGPDVQTLPDYNAAHRSVPIESASDLAQLHDVAASLKADPDAPNEEETEFRMMQEEKNYSWDVPPLPEAMRRVAVDDWRGVRDDLTALDRFPAARDPHARALLPVVTWPWLAYAEAKLGDFRSARALIDKTPLDCYLCARMRGKVEAAQMNWSKAVGWFAEAVKQGPSLPFAFTDWGEMLLHEGKYNSAIEKFRAANLKSPHFADPLEMWGEALMQERRSDLALAKFEEANKYAPNWGRLHLEWGKALMYLGRRDEAQQQFAAAAHLDLSAADAGALTKWIGRHG